MNDKAPATNAPTTGRTFLKAVRDRLGIVAEFTEIEEYYLDLRRLGYGPATAARELGSSMREIAAYAAANPDFADAVEAAVAEALERVENKVYEAGQDGDLIAARMILESHRPDKWMKPDRDRIALVGLPDNIDLGSLAARLESARMKAIEATSHEATDDEGK